MNDRMPSEQENGTHAAATPTTLSPNAGEGFGTFGGVFTPTVLTILGAIMYLREGWVVGNAGLGGAVVIILLANIITVTTALSIASVVTNIRVRAGGAFSIISQSLGLEVGGSVSLPLYLAQALSVAFYLFAFSEGWARLFPRHPPAVVVFIGFAAAMLIAWISANLAVRVQYLIMAIVAASLVSVLLGALPAAGGTGLQHTPDLWGAFPSGDFWEIFAVFFPAVTGVLAGVNMSGALKAPRRSIPIGTLTAVVLTLVIYLLLAYWLARVASTEELVANETVMVDKALWGGAVLAGILAATFSSALTSLVGAPRILQAMAVRGVIPRGEWLAQETGGGEPRQALLLTGAIGLMALVFGLLSGGLNAIAPLITMFFLIMYTTLNGVVLLEETLGLISFRPLLRVPRWVPLVGLVSCLFVMFRINPSFSLVALALTLAVYVYLARRKLVAPWSDVRSGLFFTLAEWAAKRVARNPSSQERAWRPNLLVPVLSPSDLVGSYRFLQAITYPRGSVRILGQQSGDIQGAGDEIESIARAFIRDGVFAWYTRVENHNFEAGLTLGMEVLKSVFFRPNVLFLPISESLPEEVLQRIISRAREHEIGAALFAQHPVTNLGRERVVNVWIREQSPSWELGLRLTNLDLSLLLAYQVAKNWSGRINLVTVVQDSEDRSHGERFLKDLIDLGRMPGSTEIYVGEGELDAHLSKAPRADLNIFGLSPQVDLGFIERVVDVTGASCLIVRDSGHESALA